MGWLRSYVVAGLFLLGCASTGARPAAPSSSSAPAWLPPYTPEQLSLLEPGQEAAPVAATRTYPDLVMFRYSHDRLLEDPRDAMRTTKLIADLVSESPRSYTVAETPPRIANDIAQYGPPPKREPDGWVVATRDPEGRLQLAPVSAPKEARAAFDEAVKALAAGRAQDAERELARAVQVAPHAAAIHVELGRALLAQKKLVEAEAAFREALRADVTLASGHEGLAATLLARGDVYGARESLAHALAYHPFEPRAVALAAKLTPETPPERPTPFAIFLEVDAAGVVRVGTGSTVGSRMYAGCRAVMRYEPELRTALFNVAPEAPYFLSAAEEMFCIESAIGAFIAERAVAREEGLPAPQDKQTAALTGLAHTEGLLGFVMVEVLGRHRPEHARTAPSVVHRAMVAYVARHVLGYDPGPNVSNYVASAR
ncbi:MAG: hypothetical protein IPG04_13780 [Polyangiaceae bacterium]|jgi:tetratricopeptide (TPR) repeat protein|nr:hypothetical protein [Polyangiaceae bacterium]